MTHSTTLDALANGFVAFSPVANRNLDVSVLNRFWAHIDHEFISDVNLFEFNLNNDLIDGF